MFEARNFFYKDIFTQEECLEIKDEFFSLLENAGVNNQDYPSLYDGAIGYTNVPSTIKSEYLDRMLRLIEKDFYRQDWKIIFENSYTRLYKKDSYLSIHNDRPGLEITLSINIAGIEDWKLNVSNVMYETWRADYSWDPYSDPEKYKKDFTSYITPRGSGIACYGRSYPHWRDPLICKDDEYVVQLFYHWSYWTKAELA